jgi:hypothetical protein
MWRNIHIKWDKYTFCPTRIEYVGLHSHFTNKILMYYYKLFLFPAEQGVLSSQHESPLCVAQSTVQVLQFLQQSQFRINFRLFWPTSHEHVPLKSVFVKRIRLNLCQESDRLMKALSLSRAKSRDLETFSLICCCVQSGVLKIVLQFMIALICLSKVL